MKLKQRIGRKNEKLISEIPKKLTSLTAYPPMSMIMP
jgi:hypothetical protein